MRYETEWARQITNISEMVDQILSRDYDPMSARGLIPQVVTEATVNDVIRELTTRCGEHYVDCLRRFVESVVDLDADWSLEQFRNMSCVVDGRLTQAFRTGAEVLRAYFTKATVNTL